MSRRKQEEKIVAQLRELAALPGNKHCFDCAQRGPTYVNMTIGSFTCTSCSGILRGLNPPHRVKSISMATFTPDEYEFIKSRGNDHCRRIWLGLYDNDSRPVESGYKDESHMKDFLITKYEKKRWYVSPSEVARQKVLLDRAQSERRSTTASDTLSQASTGSPASVSRSGITQQPQHHPSLIDTSSPRTPHTPQQKTDFDPFSSPQRSVPQPAQPTSSNGFADFASAFSGGGFTDALHKSQTVPAISPAAPAVRAPPPGATALQSNQPTPWANGAPAAPPPAPPAIPPGYGQAVRPLAPANPQAPPAPVVTAPPQPSAADKYSALAELDGLFSSSKSSLGGGGDFNSFAGGSGQSAGQNTGTIYGATPMSQPSVPAHGGSVFGTSPGQGGSVFGTAPSQGRPQAGFGAPQHQMSQAQAMPKSQSAFGGFASSQQMGYMGQQPMPSNPFVAGSGGAHAHAWGMQQQGAPNPNMAQMTSAANPFLASGPPAQGMTQPNPWGQPGNVQQQPNPYCSRRKSSHFQQQIPSWHPAHRPRV